MSKPTIGQLADEAFELREQRRILEAQSKELKEAQDALEAQLLETMHEQGIDKAAGSSCTISISKTETANVQDWDKLYRYVKRNNAFHLIQRRISSAAYVETVNSRNGKDIPGCTKFTKYGINMRVKS